MSEELAVITQQPIDALAINRAPEIVLEEAMKAAKALTDVIEKKTKKLTFNGKTYLQFEDWQTLGRFYGVTAVVRSTKHVEYGEGDDKVQGFEAICEALLVSTNQVISSAEAMCLNDEPNWTKKPLFQLKSMAQTRGCAKALRNVLAWVVVLAGYAPTPAEEMDGQENGQQYVNSPKRKSEPIKTASVVQADVPVPEELNGLFEDAEPVRELRAPFVEPVLTQCPVCRSTRIQPAGVSKAGRKYKAFCKDCADAKKASA